MFTTETYAPQSNTAPFPTGERHRQLWEANLAAVQTYVYVIQGDPHTPVKIGYAQNVTARMKTLQTGNPQLLHLLYVLPAPRSVESSFHRELAMSRIIGEWFSGKAVDSVIERIARVADEMVAAYDGSGTPPDVFDFDSSLDRKAEPVETEDPIVFVPKGRPRRTTGNFFGKGMRLSWREKPAVPSGARASQSSPSLGDWAYFERGPNHGHASPVTGSP